MRALTYVVLAAMLAGCSSFNLGAILYCPHGEACAFQKYPAPQAEKAEPAANDKKL